jgi:hypothetical protein
MPRIQLYRPEAIVFVIFALIECAKPDELILQCKGNLGTFTSPLWNKEDEVIGVHVKNGTITFSEDDFLSGNNITICPPGTLGLPSDTLYFDSSGCSGRAQIGRTSPIWLAE